MEPDSKQSEYSLQYYSVTRLSNSVSKNVVDFSIKKLEKLSKMLTVAEQLRLIEVIDCYKNDLIAITWINGAPFFVDITEEISAI